MMFAVPTTFVVGAGASCEFGLPSGAGLQQSIVDLLKPHQGFGRYYEDGDMDRALDELSKRTDESRDVDWYTRVKMVTERVRQALPFHRSIDEFINSNQGDWLVENICKLAITVAILKAEHGSVLHPDRFSPTRIVKDTPTYASSWVSQLIRIMTANVHSASPTDMFENVSFIVFNYDRCLELSLFRALKNGFDVNDHAAEVALSSARIFHPYGRVGSLKSRAKDFVPFGHLPNDLFEVSRGISTFTESVRADISDKVKEVVLGARQLVFLGFGYIRQNMELLTPFTPTSLQTILGTSYDVSNADAPAVHAAIREITRQPDPTQHPDGILGREPVKIDILSRSCRQLVDERRFILQRRAVS